MPCLFSNAPSYQYLYRVDLLGFRIVHFHFLRSPHRRSLVENIRKRTDLSLPEPQVTDSELHQVCNVDSFRKIVMCCVYWSVLSCIVSDHTTGLSINLFSQQYFRPQLFYYDWKGLFYYDLKWLVLDLENGIDGWHWRSDSHAWRWGEGCVRSPHQMFWNLFSEVLWLWTYSLGTPMAATPMSMSGTPIIPGTPMVGFNPHVFQLLSQQSWFWVIFRRVIHCHLVLYRGNLAHPPSPQTGTPMVGSTPVLGGGSTPAIGGQTPLQQAV